MVYFSDMIFLTKSGPIGEPYKADRILLMWFFCSIAIFIGYPLVIWKRSQDKK